jgi:hypothetical protein
MITEDSSVPVLLCIFNRPEHTARSFQAIRAIKPHHLFVAADGPRDGFPDDIELCKKTRDTVKVDWDCEVTWSINPKNLGCRLGLFTAITWFFSNVSEGIILEDDCVADPSFFSFCQKMLSNFKYDKRIFGISGNNFTENRPTDDSYYFLKTTHIWGWATWSDRWRLVDLHAKEWPRLAASDAIGAFLKRPHTKKFWEYILNDLHSGQGDTWSGAIIYTMLLHDMIGVHPKYNLVSNIGFGNTGVHATPEDHWLANRPLEKMNEPLQNPTAIALSVDFDSYVEEVWRIPPTF